MHFEIEHDFDIPRDAVELAVLSPDLATRLRSRLRTIEQVGQPSHALENGVLERVWAWKAAWKIPAFAARWVKPEMVAWEERSRYVLGDHASVWSIVPLVKAEWQKFFAAGGTYQLLKLADGRTKRIVKGEVELRVSPPLFKTMGERMIVKEVRKTFDAEAATLQELATLG